jgi:hypothetical protein
MKMRCKDYQKYIYLFKEGELSAKEKRTLDIHLKKCVECSKEAELIVADFSKLNRLKENQEFIESHTVLNDIENSIRNNQNFNPLGIKEYFENILERISIPKTRFVFSAIVVLLMIVLVAQEVSVLTRITLLEKKMSEDKVETRDLSPLALSTFVSSNQDKVTVDRQTLETILESYTDLQLTNKILLDALRKAVPDLDKNFIDNGLDQEEMKKLLDKKDVIYSLIREL